MVRKYRGMTRQEQLFIHIYFVKWQHGRFISYTERERERKRKKERERKRERKKEREGVDTINLLRRENEGGETTDVNIVDQIQIILFHLCQQNL
jgi:hypothetical protein